MYRPHQSRHPSWMDARRHTRNDRVRQEDVDDWSYDDELSDRDRPPHFHRRAVSFDDGRSTVRFIDPETRLPLVSAMRSSPRAKPVPLPLVSSPLSEPGPSSTSLTIRVDHPREANKSTVPAKEGVAGGKYLPPLLTLRDFCKEYHIQRETFVKLERMGIKGPASLQYLDPGYLANPERVFYKGQQVPGLYPPELSEVRVAVERWEAGVPAKGRYLHSGK